MTAMNAAWLDRIWKNKRRKMWTEMMSDLIELNKYSFKDKNMLNKRTRMRRSNLLFVLDRLRE